MGKPPEEEQDDGCGNQNSQDGGLRSIFLVNHDVGNDDADTGTDAGNAVARKDERFGCEEQERQHNEQDDDERG